MTLLPVASRANDSFTIVALPDTQNYARDFNNAALFAQQTEWIADQVQASGNPRNIQFVTHLGDVVSKGDELIEMLRADASMTQMLVSPDADRSAAQRDGLALRAMRNGDAPTAFAKVLRLRARKLPVASDKFAERVAAALSAAGVERWKLGTAPGGER